MSNDYGLGRLPQFDARSFNFPIRPLVATPERVPRSYSWRVPITLDQGPEGSCVGHAWAHEVAARPVVQLTTHEYAKEKIYWEAQKIDPYPGGAYPGANPFSEGSSVLAGAKVCQGYGHFGEYRWAFGLDDLLLAIGYAGPAVLGINWYTGMFHPDVDGRIRVSGVVEGGHAILANRVAVVSKERSVARVGLHNSWGPDWGQNGEAWLTWDDMTRLLSEEGEACIPIGRKKIAGI